MRQPSLPTSTCRRSLCLSVLYAKIYREISCVRKLHTSRAQRARPQIELGSGQLARPSSLLLERVPDHGGGVVPVWWSHLSVREKLLCALVVRQFSRRVIVHL
eukprot:gene6932-biopygen13917